MNYARSQLVAPSRDIANDALWITYRWMSLGLAVTGLVALAVASSPDLLAVVAGNRLVFGVLVVAQLGLVFAMSRAAMRVSTGAAAAMFFGYAALTGVTLSTIFLAFTSASIASTFFVTAGTFAGLSVYGTLTRRDLSAMGRFAVFALIGLVVATLVNLFLRSSGLGWLLTIGGVVIFAGLTAYDTQRLRRAFEEGPQSPNLPLVGALILYLDFINMFLYLLMLFGNRRRE
jgi:FtsH-binding integral membrane protein